MTDFHVPAKVVANCEKSAERSAWLAQLPDVVRELEQRWALLLEAPFEGENSCAWVAPGMRGGREPVVLKVQMPHAECRDEAAGLAVWGGEGAVRLLDRDSGEGALLLERCVPGTHLRAQPEEEQDRVIAGLLRRLWVTPDDGSRFRPLSRMVNEWSCESEAFEGAWPDIGLMQEGLAMYRALLSEPADEVLLATDLHAGNVLRAEREPWLMIDPKPYLGDPAYDATQHLLNCTERLATDPGATINGFADLLELDVERIRRWVFARLATAAWGDLGRNHELARRVLGA